MRVADEEREHVLEQTINQALDILIRDECIDLYEIAQYVNRNTNFYLTSYWYYFFCKEAFSPSSPNIYRRFFKNFMFFNKSLSFLGFASEMWGIYKHHQSGCSEL